MLYDELSMLPAHEVLAVQEIGYLDLNSTSTDYSVYLPA